MAHVDVDATRLNGFCLVDELRPFRSPWHAHRKVQLLAATSGTMRLEADGGQWVVSPQRAALLGSGVEHRVSADRPVRLCTVYLAPAAVPASSRPGCAVFGLAPLAQQLIHFSARWGPGRSAKDRAANAFFTALAHLSVEWAAGGLTAPLPAARSPELELAMDHVLAHLDEPLSLARVARAAVMSPRTLARRFGEEAGLGFRRFLRQARVHAAMERLSQPGVRIRETAAACGFKSEAAFTHAFKAVTGELPRAYRARFPAR